MELSRSLSGQYLLSTCFSISLVFIPHLSHAVEFERGEVYGSFDTTVSYGQSYRLSDPDRSIIGLSSDPAGVGLSGTAAATTGIAFSENSDDGNQNYDAGIISQTARFTSELDISYRNFGLFTRFSGFKDYESDEAGNRTSLSDKADRLVTSNLNLQDLYVWGDFRVGGMPVTVKVGEQVLSWGESTFIQNGINVINPFDVSQLRTPGAEIRDALLPVGMVVASIAPTNNLSVEGYYQYDYERTLIEAPGSFFSTNDFVGEGGNKVQLGFGGTPFGAGFIGSDRGTSFGALTAAINADLAAGGFGALALAAFEPDFLGVLRTADIRPDEGGEFGVSLRYFAEELNDTEFGLYFINHHSRTPVISAITGTAAGVTNAGGAAASIAGGAFVSGAIGAAGAVSVANAVATDAYASTANYLIEYPEDIQRMGLSFNTQIKGIAFQGEYSFTHDAPLQVDDVELLFAALCPLAAINAAVTVNQIDPGCANISTGQYVPGFIERDISQFQMTATTVLGPVLKANQGVLVGEIGVTHVHNMPSKSTLRLESAGTFTSGDPFHTTTGLHASKAFEDADHFADATSWGYRLAGRLTYNDVFWGINISPRFAWSHDVGGNTPGPGGNFLEGRKAVTLGVGANYLNKWQADLGYTNFFGAGRHNLLNDRDFMALNLKYSF